MEKILLYYKFTPLVDPEAVRLWQRTLCESLGLQGRIILSPHGINGTLGGEVESLKTYIKETKAYAPFKEIAFKWSDGGARHFPKLSVKVRSEIVTFGATDELQVDEEGIVDGGTRLKPEGLHQLLRDRPEDVVLFDGRNAYEAAIGRFKDAVVPDVRHSRDFMQELQSPRYESLKQKAVVTYCTGGIRCEVLSALMKKQGFKEVYQLDGGIAKYGEKYGDQALWEGALYVFDGRMQVRFSDASKDIGECIHCAAKTSNYENCALKNCNNLVLICERCKTTAETCSDACKREFAITG